MNGAWTLLMADDDPGHAALITRSLRNAGLDQPFLYFRDGQAVLDFLAPGVGRPAAPALDTRYLLLLDIRMPKVDGIEVLRALRRGFGPSDLPVIVISTTDDPRDVASCMELGCLEYVVKSVQPQRFQESMARLVASIRRVVEPREP